MLECPADVRPAGNALALSLPAGQVHPVADAAPLRREAIAELEHPAAALEAGTGRFIALIRRRRVTIKLVFPRKPRIELAARHQLFRIAHAETNAARRHGAEIILLA